MWKKVKDSSSCLRGIGAELMGKSYEVIDVSSV